MVARGGRHGREGAPGTWDRTWDQNWDLRESRRKSRNGLTPVRPQRRLPDARSARWRRCRLPPGPCDGHRRNGTRHRLNACSPGGQAAQTTPCPLRRPGRKGNGPLALPDQRGWAVASPSVNPSPVPGEAVVWLQDDRRTVAVGHPQQAGRRPRVGAEPSPPAERQSGAPSPEKAAHAVGRSIGCSFRFQRLLRCRCGRGPSFGPSFGPSPAAKKPALTSRSQFWAQFRSQV